MKIGFLFAGQGAQHPGMGKDFYEHYDCARAVYDSVDIDIDVKQLCFAGTQEELNDTAVAQPCILTTSSAIVSVLRAHGIEAYAVAGLSLGEYSALAYAGVFTPAQGASLVRARGKIMAEALPAGTSGMAAVLNTEASVIRGVCEEVRTIGVCEIANYNCPGQIVISGQKAAVEAAADVHVRKPRRTGHRQCERGAGNPGPERSAQRTDLPQRTVYAEHRNDARHGHRYVYRDRPGPFAERLCTKDIAGCEDLQHRYGGRYGKSITGGTRT